MEGTGCDLFQAIHQNLRALKENHGDLNQNTCVPDKIRNEHLPNTNQKFYHPTPHSRWYCVTMHALKDIVKK
jgi:hypothetical protein